MAGVQPDGHRLGAAPLLGTHLTTPTSGRGRRDVVAELGPVRHRRPGSCCSVSRRRTPGDRARRRSRWSRARSPGWSVRRRGRRRPTGANARIDLGSRRGAFRSPATTNAVGRLGSHDQSRDATGPGRCARPTWRPDARWVSYSAQRRRRRPRRTVAASDDAVAEAPRRRTRRASERARRAGRARVRRQDRQRPRLSHHASGEYGWCLRRPAAVPAERPRRAAVPATRRISCSATTSASLARGSRRRDGAHDRAAPTAHVPRDHPPGRHRRIGHSDQSGANRPLPSAAMSRLAGKVALITGASRVSAASAPSGSPPRARRS